MMCDYFRYVVVKKIIFICIWLKDDIGIYVLVFFFVGIVVMIVCVLVDVLKSRI